jgi:hypothetical protein
MIPSIRIRLLSFAAAGLLVLLTTASVPARSEERPVRLGPVGPEEPIMTTVGNKNVIAFYREGDDDCNIYVVTSDRNDDSGRSAEQVRLSLNPRQIVHIDAPGNHTLNLKCTDSATTLAVVDSNGRIVFGSH